MADGLALAEAGFDLLDVGAVRGAQRPAGRAGRGGRAARPRGRGAGAPRRRAGDAPTPSQPEVARRALDAGAAAINDISGGADPEMLDLVAERGLRLRADAHRGPAARRPRAARLTDDPVAHLKRWFAGADRGGAGARRGRGADRARPGPRLRPLGRRRPRDPAAPRRAARARPAAVRRPLAQGLPRRGARRLLGGPRRRPTEREWATAAATALAVAAGAEMLRLHDRSALDALRTAAAISGTVRERSARALGGREWLVRRQRRRRWLGACDRARASGRPPGCREPRGGRGRPRRSAIPARPGARAGGRPARERDRGALLASARGARGRRRGQRDRHQRHGLRQVALLQPARSSTSSAATTGAGRSTSTRPRRSPRTRRASSPSSACRSFATRSTTATRRARTGRRSGVART